MKYLEYAPLNRINLFLDNLNLGNCTIQGHLEAFSCKQAGIDKKLFRSLENGILDYLEHSSDSDSQSPEEHLCTRASRKMFINLTLTLSHIYPDYDFSAVQAHLYFKDEEWDSVMQIFDTHLFEAAQEWAAVNGGNSFMDSLTKAIDEVIELKDCEIYSYSPDYEVDPFWENEAIWSYNFFLYNSKMKRVLSFRCSCFSNLPPVDFNEILVDDEDEDLLIDMEM